MADGAVNIDLILNDQTDKTWSEFKSKAEQQGKEGHETFKKSFGDEPLIAKLEAKANKEGITDFKSLLNELPKEKQTELLAKAEKGEAIDFEKYIKNMPKKKVVSLETQAKNAGIDNFDKLLKKLPKKTVTDLQTRAEKGEVINFEQLLHNIPSKYITQLQLNDNASPELQKLQSEAEETKHKFSNLKEVMLGTFAGNLVFKGVTALTGGFESIISDLDESSKAWQTFEGNMHEFGKSGAEIGKVKSELQDFAQKSIYSASDMASTYSQLAAVGTKNTTELVKGFGGLAAASEDPKQAMKTLSQQATQMASKPKVAWEDFKLILEQSPAGMSAVAKTMGMSVGELTQKVQNGQVATQDLFDAITKAGTSDNFTKMATNYKTVGQAVDGLREGLTNKLQSAFDSSSKVGIKMVSNISKSIDNFDTKPMMNKLSSLISYITSHSKDISGIFGSVKEIAADLIGGAWNAAKDTLTTIADMFGLINKNSKKAHDPLKTVNHVLKTIADHKGAIKALGAALVAAFAVKKISDFVGGLMLVTKNLKLAAAAQAIFNAVANANWISILVVALVGLAVGLVELYKHSKKFRDFVNGLVDAAVDFAKGVGKWFGNAFDAIGDFFKGVGKSFSNGGKNIQKFVKNIGKWFKGIGKSIGNGADAIGDWFSGLVKGFQKGWDKFIKAVKKIAIGFGKVMLYALALPIGIDIAITKPLVGPLKKIFNSLAKDVKKIWNGLTDFLRKVWQPVQKTWTKVWNAIADFFDELWNGKHGIKRLFSNAINAISDILGDVLKDISKTWSKTWNAISDFFDELWNGKHGIKRLFSDAINAISDVLDKVLGSISKTWNKVWGAIADFFDDIWNGKHGIRNTASKAWSWFSDGLSNFGDGISKTWNNMWTGIRDFFSDIWKDIKDLAKDGMNGIIGFINTGVGGINGVIHDFGGKKQTIKPLKKLATGTTGAPSGLAMVNDGFDSPTGQELIIDNQGNGTILSGRNRLVNFEGGETVVPAGVTHAMLAGHMFANGTNDWFGDVKHFFGDVAGDIGDAISSATGKAKDFLGIAMHPIKYIEDKIFSPMTKGIGNLAGSAISSLGSAVSGNNGVKGQQNNWWHELWNMLKDTMSGSGGGGLGDDYRFKNKSKDEGAPSGDPWGYFFRECVSFVASRLANVGVKPSLFTGLGNGSNWTSAHVKHKSTPSVGDIAVYSNGSKYGNHVSVVTGVNNGRYSEEGYNYAGNGKYYKSNGLKFGDATTFLNFGRSAARSKSDSNKSDSPLQKLIRSQVGGMFDWVSDMMSNLLGSFNGGGDQAGSSAAPSGSHKHWLRQAGIHGDFDKWNYIINHESGWNPKAKNPGSSAYGIGQALPPSKMASFGSDYMSNPITQLKWMKSYVNDRYGGIDHAYNFWRSHHWYANGGRTNGVGLVGEVDGEDEWVINPNRRSADETILGSIKETADKQPNSFAAKLSQVINTAKTGSQSNMITQLPHVSHTKNGGQTNGNIDLSGDVHMVVQLDSGEIAQATYPKIKMLQNQDIQLKGQITGNTYVY
ncbi:aggregation-promoting factor C-terminal-like domain-containing protein [Weissella paramesenteroides]